MRDRYRGGKVGPKDTTVLTVQGALKQICTDTQKKVNKATQKSVNGDETFWPT